MAGIVEVSKGMAKRLKISQAQATDAVNALKEEIIELCKNGEEVNLVGFAKFSKKHMPARECTNPQNPSGPKLNVAAKDVFEAKASKSVDVSAPAPAQRGSRRN